MTLRARARLWVLARLRHLKQWMFPLPQKCQWCGEPYAMTCCKKHLCGICYLGHSMDTHDPEEAAIIDGQVCTCDHYVWEHEQELFKCEECPCPKFVAKKLEEANA